MTDFVGFIFGASEEHQKHQRAAIMAASDPPRKFFVEREREAKWEFEHREKLTSALLFCRTKNCTFVLSSLTGFARRKWMGLELLRSQVELYDLSVIVADDPTINGKSIEILTAASSVNRERISAKSKAALNEIKKIMSETGAYTTRAGKVITDSRKLQSNTKAKEVSALGAKQTAARAKERDSELWPTIKVFRDRGMNYSEIARQLNFMGVETHSDKGKHKQTKPSKWHASQVRNIILRRQK